MLDKNKIPQILEDMRAWLQSYRDHTEREGVTFLWTTLKDGGWEALHFELSFIMVFPPPPRTQLDLFVPPSVSIHSTLNMIMHLIFLIIQPPWQVYIIIPLLLLLFFFPYQASSSTNFGQQAWTASATVRKILSSPIKVAKLDAWSLSITTGPGFARTSCFWQQGKAVRP